MPATAPIVAQEDDTHPLSVLRSADSVAGAREVRNIFKARDKGYFRALLSLHRALRWAGGTHQLAACLSISERTVDGWRCGTWDIGAPCRSLLRLFEVVMRLDRLPPERKPRRRVKASPCGPAPPTGCGSAPPEIPDDTTSTEAALLEAIAKAPTDDNGYCSTLFPGARPGVESSLRLFLAYKRVTARATARHEKAGQVAKNRERWKARVARRARERPAENPDRVALDWQI